MKKIIFFVTVGLFGLMSCNENFLNLKPKGVENFTTYTDTSHLNKKILVEAKLLQTYATLRIYAFQWPGLAMNNYPTPDAEKGSTPSDGGADMVSFKSLSYTPGNTYVRDYYVNCYNTIYLSNEAVALIASLADTVPLAIRKTYLAEALFLRSVMYYRLAQAFGGVPFVDKVLGQNDKTPPRSTRDEIWSNIERDLLLAIPFLPSRIELNTSGNQGRATQNAARAVLAKVYLYEKKWSDALTQTTAIITSGDNDLSTPYKDMFSEANEYGPESVFEVYCDDKPTLKIDLSSQFGQIQGIRGIPNLGWGFNAPSLVLQAAYETGDPRKFATVIANGDTLEGTKVRADAASFPFFNKKAYTLASERSQYGRSTDPQAYWMNIRIIRYADVLLMHAEAANELGNTAEALDKLELVRARARAGNIAILPKITFTDQTLLRAAIHQERRIELALEWERFYDLIRWDEAKTAIPNFITGKHELYPIPQTEIDRSGGIITQNPGY